MGINKDGSIEFGNPTREVKKKLHTVINQYYNPNTKEVLNLYCVSAYGSKRLDYFIEVCPKDKHEYVITGNTLQKGI